MYIYLFRLYTICKYTFYQCMYLYLLHGHCLSTMKSVHETKTNISFLYLFMHYWYLTYFYRTFRITYTLNITYVVTSGTNSIRIFFNDILGIRTLAVGAIIPIFRKIVAFYSIIVFDVVLGDYLQTAQTWANAGVVFL